MGRARHCSICASDPAISSQVNAQIEAGCKQKLIHEQNPQFSVSQISRHTRGCLAPKPTPDLSTEQGSAEIARWLERAESTFLVAQANGDTKSAASAISTAVRTLSAMHRKQAEEAEAAKAVADDRHSVQALDQQVKEFMAQRDSERGGIGTKSACLCEEEPKFGELVLVIWSDRRLLDTILIHAKGCAAIVADGFIPPRETTHADANN